MGQVTPYCCSTNRWPQHAGIWGTSHPSTKFLWLSFSLTKGHAAWKTQLVFTAWPIVQGQGKKHCSGHQGKVCSPSVVVAVLEISTIYSTTSSLTGYPLFFQQLVLPCLLLPVALTFSFHLSNVTALRSNTVFCFMPVVCANGMISYWTCVGQMKVSESLQEKQWSCRLLYPSVKKGSSPWCFLIGYFLFLSLLEALGEWKQPNIL